MEKLITFLNVVAFVLLIWQLLGLVYTILTLREYQKDPLVRARYLIKGTTINVDATRRNIVRNIIFVILLIAFIIIF